MKLFTSTYLVSVISFAGLAVTPAYGQQAPGAGLIYQQSQKKVLAPQSSSDKLTFQGKPLTDSQEGGKAISVRMIQLQGNTVFDRYTLLAQLGDYRSKKHDLAALRQLANRLSQFYREQGYPFSYAVIPPQNIVNGELLISIQEGRYSQVFASGESHLASASQAYLKNLQSGNVIESSALERGVLILTDLPGVTVIPVLRPGNKVGTGELDVKVRPDKRMAAAVSVDNHGSRFSGEYRGRADIEINRIWLVGDELSVSALYTDEETWLGSLNYSFPLASNGLRGFIGYSQTDYSLGQGFEGYTGTAKVASLGASYPLLRSQLSNASLLAQYQYKDLNDEVDFARVSKATDSQSIPLSMQFDHRDKLGKGGITWGAITLTPGEIKVDNNIANNQNYRFLKANIELSRIQSLTPTLNLYGRFSGQWADRKDLDGSESFYLGGADGVRAYPVSEGSDSRGWLTQLELRYTLGQGFSPYLLLDSGITPNGGNDQGESRSLTGAGAGIRYYGHNWNADLVAAWKVSGGEAQADGKQQDPRFWFNLGYDF